MDYNFIQPYTPFVEPSSLAINLPSYNLIISIKHLASLYYKSVYLFNWEIDLNVTNKVRDSCFLCVFSQCTEVQFPGPINNLQHNYVMKLVLGFCCLLFLK